MSRKGGQMTMLLKTTYDRVNNTLAHFCSAITFIPRGLLFYSLSVALFFALVNQITHHTLML